MSTPIIVTSLEGLNKNISDPANMFGERPGIKTKRTEEKISKENYRFLSKAIRWSGAIENA
jgi:hypothetical protein